MVPPEYLGDTRSLYVSTKQSQLELANALQNKVAVLATEGFTLVAYKLERQ